VSEKAVITFTYRSDVKARLATEILTMQKPTSARLKRP